MTIKQQGGIFGRNPSFNDASVEDLTVTNSVSVPNDSISGDAVDGGTITPTKLLVNTDANPNSVNSRFFGITEFDSAGATLVDFLTSNGATTLGSIGQGNYVVSGAPSNSFGIRSNANLPIAAGGSTKVADFTVNGLAFVNGKGIDFSATSGTGTSELFDDYEEGTWTPVVSDATSGGNTGTATVAYATYTKVGNLVHLKARLLNMNTTGMGSGNIYVQGVPYAADGDGDGLASTSFFTAAANSLGIVPSIDNGASHIKLKEVVSGGVYINADSSQFASGTADLWITITYHT